MIVYNGIKSAEPKLIIHEIDFGYTQHCSAPTPKPDDHVLEIQSDGRPLVSMNRVGEMTFGDGYIPTEAAKIFWDAVLVMTPPEFLIKRPS